MELIKKHTNLFVSLLFLVIYLGIFLFVRNALNQDTAEFKETSKDTKEKVETKPAKVRLVIEGISTYSVRLENKDTLGDLLEYLRKNEGLTYSLEYNTRGTRIVAINGVSNGSKSWVFYDGEVFVGYEFKDYKLDDNNTYYLRLE